MSMTAEGVLEELTRRSVETKLSDDIRADVEKKANVNLSGVKMFYNSDLMRSMGEMAFTKGNQIHVQEGAFSQSSAMGKRILTHELNHVIQQGTGKAAGTGILSDSGMESQADSGVGLSAEGFSMPSFSSSPAQGWNAFGWIKNMINERREKKRRHAADVEEYKQLIAAGYNGTLSEEQIARKAELGGWYGSVGREAQLQYNRDMMESLDAVSANDTRFMTDAEMAWFNDQKYSNWATGKKGFNKDFHSTHLMFRASADNDFSNYFHMSKVAKLALATQHQKNSLNSVEAINALNTNDSTAALNPMNRKAMQIMAKMGAAEAGKENADQNIIALGQASENKGRAMDSQMMKNTMYATTEAQRQAVYRHFAPGGEAEGRDRREKDQLNWFSRTFLRYGGQAKTDTDALRTHEAASNLMLKTMMLAQLGNTSYVNEETGETENWGLDMANLFGNGARTAIITPENDAMEGGKTSKDFFKNFLGGSSKGDLKRKGIFSRTAATHGFSPETVGGDQFDEKHGKKSGFKSILTALPRMFSSKAAGTSMIRHYGMDMAVGGLANEGVTATGGRAQTIMNDGRSGHMYMGALAGNDAQKGTILMGIESDSPYHIGQTGHMHNAAAQGEDASNTGGLKSGLVGRKYNGRKIDVSNFSNTAILKLMNAIDNLAPDKRNDVVNQLSGGRLGPEEFAALLTNIGVNDPVLLAEIRGLRQ